MDKTTEPPCSACNAHDKLEYDMENMNKKNTQQHNDILNALDVMASNIKWMNLIGKFILATFITYMLAIGYRIYFFDFVTHKEISKIEKDVDDGEKLHYKNENTINNIEGKIDIMLDMLGGKK